MILHGSRGLVVHVPVSASMIGINPHLSDPIASCDGRISMWPDMLPYVLWADRCTHTSVTGFMPSELLLGQKPIMPTE